MLGDVKGSHMPSYGSCSSLDPVSTWERRVNTLGEGAGALRMYAQTLVLVNLMLVVNSLLFEVNVAP